MNRNVLVLLLLAFPGLSAGQSDARVIKPEIRVGDSWTYRSTNLLGPGTHELESRVSFADAIEVPAGKFRAIKVELDTMVQPSGSRAFQRHVTFWYVPEVRRWVKLQGATPKNRFSEELLEYKLNED